ncbi:MAG: hypothetical protein BA866_01420 [Desulfobulbaceae bacterium S5133MH15]|nr:MAG: hypothetical protein BA866_01420 [Desulfobulbaceae bacterium S5133MH15]
MSYSSVLSDLIARREDVFLLAVNGKCRKFVIFNLLILGVLFGLSNFIGAVSTTPELPLDGKFAFITPLIFCISGFFTMSTALIGFVLVYWSAARAFDGPGGFALIFDLLGLALIPFWIIAPFLNYAIHFAGSQVMTFVLLAIVCAGAVWAFQLTRDSLVVGQGLSRKKAAIAVCCMWIFSVSSIYVFLP